MKTPVIFGSQIKKSELHNRMNRKFSQTRQTACEQCRNAARGGIQGAEEKAKTSGYNYYTLKFDKYKNLRFGSIYSCKKCKTLWYYHPDYTPLRRIPEDQLETILFWNDGKIELSNANKITLTSIGETPCGIHNYRKNFTQFPSGVLTMEGEKIDLAIVSFQKHAPYEENYRLGDEIREIYESPYALPLDVRQATSVAHESSNSFYPTYITIGERKFIINGRVNFFYSILDAQEAKLAEKDKCATKTPIIDDPPNITYFVCDPLS